ncbi:unnamed protein product [Brassica rapa subsp. narinosa]
MSKPWNLKEEDDDKVVFDTSGNMIVNFDNSVENVRRRRCLRRKRKRSLGSSKFNSLEGFSRVDGLPPLSEIENIRREKSSKNLQELRQNSRFDRRLPNQVCDKWIEHGDPMEPGE